MINHRQARRNLAAFVQEKSNVLLNWRHQKTVRLPSNYRGLTNFTSLQEA